MNIILDIIVLAIILFVAIRSAKKGFVRILIEVVGLIAVSVFAFSVSTPLANATYDKFIEPALIDSIKEEIDELSYIDTNIIVEESVLKNLPQFLKNSVENFGFSYQSISKTLSANIENGANAAAVAVSKDVIKPAIVNIISLLYSAILIIFLSFIVRLLAKAINKIISFSFADKLNRFLGGITGIFKGIILAILICNLISLIISFTNNGFFIFTSENIENTYIFKHFIGLITLKI